VGSVAGNGSLSSTGDELDGQDRCDGSLKKADQDGFPCGNENSIAAAWVPRLAGIAPGIATFASPSPRQRSKGEREGWSTTQAHRAGISCSKRRSAAAIANQSRRDLSCRGRMGRLEVPVFRGKEARPQWR
jgi:hypothetical protein